MTWGDFRVDETVEGGVIELKGGNNDAGLVYAGPNRLPDRHNRGVIEVQTAGTRAAVLYAKARTTGGVALCGLRRVPLGDGATGRAPIAFAVLECADSPNENERWGSLTLKNLVQDGDQLQGLAVATVELDANKGLGSLRIFDARRPEESFAILEVDEVGPQLYLFGGGRHIRISPAGIEQSPDKAIEPAREQVDVGDIRGGVGLGVEVPGVNPPAELNFVAEHPEDPGLHIYYNVLEGPEVGVYVRGSLRLREGRAIAPLPEHFRHVAGADGMTVQLTPRSAASRGVAATRLTREEIEVQELAGGTGEYDVDFVVHAVRQGREGFRVLRPRRLLAWPSSPSKDRVATPDVELI